MTAIGLVTRSISPEPRAVPDEGATLTAEGNRTGGGRPLHPVYDHPGTPARLAALQEVAAKTGATADQVVPAWLMGGDPPAIPIVGISSVAQLEEVLAAADPDLGDDLRHRLDDAGGFDL